MSKKIASRICDGAGWHQNDDCVNRHCRIPRAIWGNSSTHLPAVGIFTFQQPRNLLLWVIVEVEALKKVRKSL